MSYILEALKKAQAERQLGAAPDVHAPVIDAYAQRLPARPTWLPAALGSAAAVAAIGLVLWWRQGVPDPAAPQAAVRAHAGATAVQGPATAVPVDLPTETVVVAQPGTVQAVAAHAPAGQVAVVQSAPAQPVAAPTGAAPLAHQSAPQLGPQPAQQPATQPVSPPVRQAGVQPALAQPSTAQSAAAAHPATQPSTAQSSAVQRPAAQPAVPQPPTAAQQEAARQPAPRASGETAAPAQVAELAARSAAAQSASAAAPGKPAAAPEPPEEAIPTARDLPEPIQRILPTVAMSGYMYSRNPADRMVLIDRALRREGDEVAPGLVLERLLPKGAVFVFRGYRYRVPY